MQEQATTTAQSEAPNELNTNTDETEQEVDAGEFQITIRKLQNQVRPRGVLAE
jgi:hypothetical protein